MRRFLVGVLIVPLMVLTFAAMPTLAVPSEEQKVPVKVTFQIISSETILVENIISEGNISHRLLIMHWHVNLTVGDSDTPLMGSAEVIRDTNYRYSKPGGVDQIIFDNYTISFPTQGGGFEGFSHSTLTDYVKGPPVTYNIDVHVLLHGTGDFDGQTLNAWQTGAGTTPLWEGYLLKP